MFVELDMRENVRAKVGGITRSAATMALLGGTEVVSDTSKGVWVGAVVLRHRRIRHS